MTREGWVALTSLVFFMLGLKKLKPVEIGVVLLKNMLHLDVSDNK